MFGLVRNTEVTESRLAKDGIKNVTLLQADVTDSQALSKAANAVVDSTGGSLDLLINNAAVVGGTNKWVNLPDYPSPLELEKDLEEAFKVNVVGVAFVTNTFLPLIRKGNSKKVITISTGMADDDLINQFSIGMSGPYSVSKAATNTLVAKYNAALGQSEGILFLSISPGLVDTSEGKPMSEEDMQGAQAMGAAFATYAPHFTGPITPEQSVRMVDDVIDKATVETMGGAFVSHFGNKQWL